MKVENDSVVISKLKEIIVNNLDTSINSDQIDPEISLYEDGIGLDSIAIVNFIVQIEMSFNIKFEEDEINVDLFKNLNHLAKFIERKLNLEC